MTVGPLSRMLSWAARNERRLGALLFAFGFLTDLLTFGFLPAATVSYFFVAYLLLAAGSSLGAHYFSEVALSPEEPWWRRTLSVVLPLLTQYAFGGLLSGLVVFYAANSVLLVSWPFILLLGIVYFGNEYFRMYKHFLVFQTSLFFFTLYAYAIFGLPLLLKTLNAWVFFGSTVLALVLFAVFVWLLRLVNRKRVGGAFRQIAASAVGIVVLVSGSYFLGVIPPIPLALADSGVYHSLARVPGGYRVEGEGAPPWWHFSAPVVHYTEGEFLYIYSAVAAPVSFGANVAHRWERYVDGKGWVTEGRIFFPISGGREGGYRGYSAKSNITPGKWRVSVETENGQVIGRLRFNVLDADTPPTLIEETL